jgi:HPt (histidine-containing phosphotransfer) domain-containing protein
MPSQLPTVDAGAADTVCSDFAGDPDFRELLEQFAAAMPERVAELREAHRSAAYEALQVQAHQLKGAGGGFGFPQLTELAAELEQACVSHDPLRIITALVPVLGYLKRVTSASCGTPCSGRGG